MYPEEMVKPMQAELTSAGFQDLHSAEAVENAIKAEGTTLVVVNSVCGCAARNARPGAKMSLDGAKKPDHLITVFAGVDKDAVDIIVGKSTWLFQKMQMFQLGLLVLLQI